MTFHGTCYFLNGQQDNSQSLKTYQETIKSLAGDYKERNTYFCVRILAYSLVPPAPKRGTFGAKKAKIVAKIRQTPKNHRQPPVPVHRYP